MDHNELDQLKAELQRMQARLEHLEGPAADEPVSRRNMLRGIGAAAAGAAVGGLAFARPAAAAPIDMFTESSHTAQAPTEIVTGNSYSASLGGDFMGAFSVTTDPDFTNINAALSCISAYADSSLGGGQTIGLFSASTAGIGAKLDGPVPLKLTDNTNSGPPTQSAGDTGQFKVDDGDLWFCVTDTGTKRWRKLTGTTAAGAFHAVTPGRVHDSRPGNGGAGPLVTGLNRTISVANRINPTGGAVVESNFVPAGASAVTLNITAVTTVGNGYFAVNPGGNTTVGASAINWTAGQTVANGIVCALNTTRQLTIIAGGSVTSSNFIIDITGYYL
ncbi:MAG: hypothetical protein Q8M22_04415 [Actinomycetota bacterium]|nr:hypothetical protein [Actinomycetota bacterium]